MITLLIFFPDFPICRTSIRSPSIGFMDYFLSSRMSVLNQSERSLFTLQFLPPLSVASRISCSFPRIATYFESELILRFLSGGNSQSIRKDAGEDEAEENDSHA